MALLTLSFVYIWRTDYVEYVNYWRSIANYAVIFLYVVLLAIFTVIYNSNKIGILRLAEIIYSFFLTLLLTDFVTYIQFWLIAREVLSPLPMLELLFIQMATASAGAFLINKLYFYLYPARRVLMICADNDSSAELIRKIKLKRDRYKISELINENQGFDKIKESIDKYESVMISSVSHKLRRKIFSYCSFSGKRLYITPDIQDVMIKSSHKTQIFDTPMFYCKNTSLSAENAIMKRLIDIIFSLIGLVFFAPFMLIAAICIKIEDKGPVFFRQERLTQNGKKFKVYKLRSMYVNAEKHSGAVLASKRDPRITKVGHIIRMLRLDEVPQIFNILKGEMSIVGPRPERPEISALYERTIPEFCLRLNVKAGLTGYAQIYGRYSTSPKDKLLLDLMYIENYSVLLDLQLMFMTIKILFMPESSEGIDEDENAQDEEKEPPAGNNRKNPRTVMKKRI
ncbi:MAG: sugar transferase [Oscillospiraceae bacterium]|jgi:exopolysaccharide biosynthesis polyprenyl glycosylphosphotransferase|nr:sugar transferase [Oscillospiraceae bacterium]